MITREYDAHVCTPLTTGYKTLEIDFFQPTKDVLGRDVVLVMGMDGILYTLVKREKRESDKVPFCPSLLLPSDESLQPRKKDGTDEDLTVPLKRMFIY